MHRPRQRIEGRHLTGERALFGSHDLDIADTTFGEGESPLKHAEGIRLSRSVFGWKYPLWYASDIGIEDSGLLEEARSGVWYTHDIAIARSTIAAPKTFRRSQGISLEHVDLPHAAESLWKCRDVRLVDVSANGDYFGMDSRGVRATGLRLKGNYAFDGGADIEIDGGVLLSKDAFWNCQDVLVRDAVIIGEYLGWNSTNLTFENCTIESLQGLCFVNGLRLRHCRLVNTRLAFEYSVVEAQVDSTIDSVINPAGGIIDCWGIGELIQDDPALDPAATCIRIGGIPPSQEGSGPCQTSTSTN